MRNIMIHRIFITFCLLMIHTGFYGVEVKLSVDKSMMYLTGERIRVLVTVIHSPDEEIIYDQSDTFLSPKEFYTKIFTTRNPKNIPDLEPLKGPIHTVVIKDLKDGKEVWESYEYELQIFEIESLKISPIKFLLSKDGKPFVLYSPGTFIHKVPNDLNRINGLTFKDISEPNLFSLSDFPWYILAIGLEGLFILFIVTSMILRFRRWTLLSGDSLISPIEQAYSKLNLLKTSLVHLTPNENKRYLKNIYIDMSKTLKYFMERKYFVMLVEKNTQEFSELLTGYIKDSTILGKVKSFFKTCDQVKFAAQIKDRKEIEYDISMEKQIISSIEQFKDSSVSNH